MQQSENAITSDKVTIEQWGGDLVTYLPAKLVPALLSLLTIPIVTRLFSPEHYGNYILALSTVSVMVLVSSTWLLVAVVRFFPIYRLKSRLSTLYSTTLALIVVSVGLTAIIALGVLSGIKDLMSPNLHYLMLIGLLLFITNSVFSVLREVLRARCDAGLYTSFSLWNSLASLLIGLALVLLLGFGVEGLLWGSIVSIAVVLPFLYKFAFKGSTIKTSFLSGATIREMATFGFPLVFTYLFSWVLTLSDRYVLQIYRGSSEVGLYATSGDLAEGSISFIVSLFALAGGPLIVRVWESEGAEATRGLIGKLTRYYLVICLPAIVGLSVLSRPFIDVFAAPDYYVGFKIVPLVACGSFLMGLEWLAQFGLYLKKKTNVVMFIFLGSALLNVVLNILFVPRYGFFAVGVNTLASNAVCFLLVAVISGKQVPWDFPTGSLKKVSLAAAVMGIVVYLFSSGVPLPAAMNLLLSVCIGILTYSLSLFLIGEVKRQEISLALALANSLARRITPRWKR